MGLEVQCRAEGRRAHLGQGGCRAPDRELHSSCNSHDPQAELCKQTWQGSLPGENRLREGINKSTKTFLSFCSPSSALNSRTSVWSFAIWLWRLLHFTLRKANHLHLFITVLLLNGGHSMHSAAMQRGDVHSAIPSELKSQD